MPTLRDLLATLQQRPDVAGALVLGRDGLLVDTAGFSGTDPEHLAALAPAVAQAADMLGDATGEGVLTTAVLELERGLVVLTALSPDVLLLTQLAPDADPAGLVYELRRSRARLTTLV